MNYINRIKEERINQKTRELPQIPGAVSLLRLIKDQVREDEVSVVKAKYTSTKLAYDVITTFVLTPLNL